MNNKIPTVEEVIHPLSHDTSEGMLIKFENIPKVIDLLKQNRIRFAKMHVEAALEAAAKDANMIGVTQHDNYAPDVFSNFVYVINENGPDYGYTVNKDAIHNSYSESNIK